MKDVILLDDPKIINDLEWQGNSRKMYEAIINGVPFFLAGNVKSSIANWLQKNKVHTVTEELVFKAVDEIAPANIANNMITPELNKLRSRQ